LGRVLSDYRAFVIDATGHVVKRHDFTAEDDVRALQRAQRYLDRHDIEVWQFGRVVGKLKSKE
jgi:hypothetical protein